MKGNHKLVYRIIDDNSSLYFSERHCIENERAKSISDYGHKQTSKEKTIIQKALHTVSNNNRYSWYYVFDGVGRFYPTRHGAEKMISEFTQTNKYDRDTPAKRVLYGTGKINLRVTKSKIIIRDVKEEEIYESK